MDQAKLVASWSKDPKHKVGAVIVDAWNRQISIGYNGPPRMVKDRGLSQNEKTLRSLHAELNAILNSNTDLTGTIMYVYPYGPCAQCAAAIIQKQISKVIYYCDRNLNTWRESQIEAGIMFKEAGVQLIKYGEYESSFWDDK